MNAITFIKQHGVEKARDVIAKDRFVADLCLVTPSGNLIYYKEVKGSFPEVADFRKVELTADDYLMLELSDLKRLVESVDYVLIHGHEKSKEILKNAPVGAECYSWSIGNSGARDKTVELVKLKQAIADYESLFSNDMRDDSHIENHVSPLCKMGVK